MAILKSKNGKYYNVPDELLAGAEVDVLDLPEGELISDQLLDSVSGGDGYSRYSKSVAMGVRG